MSGLWNWKLDGSVAATEIRAALAEVLGLPVHRFGEVDPARPAGDVMLCDVWQRPGAYPVSVDCYGPPAEVDEAVAVAGFARRIGRACLLPDDTLDPGRYLLVAPDGAVRPVHLEVRDTDDGELLSGQRLCTLHSPHCRRPGVSCRQSRWAPDTVIPALAAA